MKNFILISILVIFLVQPAFTQCQYEPHKLYLTVMDSIGIPTITISNNDTLLYASDTKAETIFEKYGV